MKKAAWNILGRRQPHRSSSARATTHRCCANETDLAKLLDLDFANRDELDSSELCEVIRRNPSAARRKYQFSRCFRPCGLYQFTGRFWEEKEVCLPLFPAIALHASPEAIELLLGAYPEAARAPLRKDLGTTALHFAAKYSAPLEVVRLLIAKNPKALKTKDITGHIPLHHAFHLQAPPLGLVKLLLEKSPKCIKLTDGFALLLDACKHKTLSLELMQYLVEKYSGVIEATFSGWSKLINAACKKPLQVPVVKFLLDQCPEAASQIDREYGMPLHTAFLHSNPSLELVQLLVERHQESVKVRYVSGGTVLHTACESEKTPMALVQFLVGMFPGALHMRDNIGWTPLHHVCGRASQIDLVRFLVDQCPSSVAVTDIWGYTPLHVACMGKADVDVVRLLLQAGDKDLYEVPVGAMFPDSPLHLAYLACDNKAPLEVIKILIEAFPDALGGNNRDLFAVACRFGRSAAPEAASLLWTFHELLNMNPAEASSLALSRQLSSMDWPGGAWLVVATHPSLLHSLDIDDRLIPHILSKARRYRGLKSMFEMMKGWTHLVSGYSRNI